MSQNRRFNIVPEIKAAVKRLFCLKTAALIFRVARFGDAPFGESEIKAAVKGFFCPKPAALILESRVAASDSDQRERLVVSARQREPSCRDVATARGILLKKLNKLEEINR